jgi:hypothetical protein
MKEREREKYLQHIQEGAALGDLLWCHIEQLGGGFVAHQICKTKRTRPRYQMMIITQAAGEAAARESASMPAIIAFVSVLVDSELR